MSTDMTSYKGPPFSDPPDMMPIERPEWAMTQEEALRNFGYLRVLKEDGILLPEQSEEFFSSLPKRIEAMCASVDRLDDRHACVAAINVLYKRSTTKQSPLSFVDEELIGKLEHVLEAVGNGDGIKNAIMAMSLQNPIAARFTTEMTPDLTADDIEDALTTQVKADIKVNMVTFPRIAARLATT